MGPQWSIVSTILFSIFLNGFFFRIKQGTAHNFADGKTHYRCLQKLLTSEAKKAYNHINKICKSTFNQGKQKLY